jgi:hypothetical protein
MKFILAILAKLNPPKPEPKVKFVTCVFMNGKTFVIGD